MVPLVLCFAKGLLEAQLDRIAKQDGDVLQSFA